MRTNTKVKDHFENPAEFGELLEVAEEYAYFDADVVFVDNMVSKYADYGVETYCSESQLARLRRIAKAQD